MPSPGLNRERLGVLIAWADGRRVEVARRRLIWFVENGYVILDTRPLPRKFRTPTVERYGTLTTKAWAVLETAGIQPALARTEPFKICTQGTGYVPAPKEQ